MDFIGRVLIGLVNFIVFFAIPTILVIGGIYFALKLVGREFFLRVSSLVKGRRGVGNRIFQVYTATWFVLAMVVAIRGGDAFLLVDSGVFYIWITGIVLLPFAVFGALRRENDRNRKRGMSEGTPNKEEQENKK